MLTVAIPTYNRKDVLSRVLQALTRQTLSLSGYEIIIVDDGSNDGTAESIRKFCNSPVSIRYFFQKNKGPATARNLAVKEAKNKLILFINDDTIPAEDLIEQHVLYHQKWPDDNVAVLGHALWAEGIEVPVYARHYLVAEYKKLEGLDEVRPVDFITCNISVKKDFLIHNGFFDEDFPYAAHEDRELGYRLGKKGLRIKYNQYAFVYHYHIFQDPEPFLRHNRHLGAALAIWESKIPDERNVLFEFDLPDYSTPLKVIREIAKKLVFNNKTLTCWLWLISKFKNNESFTGYLYQHILTQTQREGYGQQKRLMISIHKGIRKNAP